MILFFLDYIGIFEGINAYMYDLSFRMRGSLKPSEKILIAAIDEKSLERLGRWPLKRTYYAGLLDKMQQASVVGFDVILSESSADDAVLSEAIKRHGRVILPVYIDRNLDVIKPAGLFSPHKTGHIHIEQGVDNIAREVFHTISYKGIQLPSLTSVMYESFMHTHFKRQKAVLTVQDLTGKSIYQMDPLKINFYGKPGTFHYLSFIDILDGKYQSDFFQGKAVLVGLTAPGIVDMVATPFSEQRNRMPGAEVHTNILNNLIDGNPVRDTDERIRWLLILVLSLFSFFLFMKFSEKKAALWWITLLILSTAAVFVLFAALNIWLSPALFLFSISFIYLMTYILRLDEAAQSLDSKYSMVTRLIGGDQDLPQKRVYPGGIVTFLSPEGIHVKVQRLISAEHQYEKMLEHTIQKKTKELSHALSMISNMSNEMIMRLTAAAESKDDHTGKHISRIGLYANKMAETMDMPSDFIEKITLASAMHDIGKIGIPDHILLKPGYLTTEEFEIIKNHTTIGSKILTGSAYPMIQMSATIALFHHEKWDGTGYPKGLKGGDIPLEARIIMLCDIYDALRSSRPYKPPFDHQKAFMIITQGDIKTMPEHFDPDVLHAFIQIEQTFHEIFDTYRY